MCNSSTLEESQEQLKDENKRMFLVFAELFNK